MLQKASFTFDASISKVFWPLLTGAGLVLARPDGQKDPAYLIEAITTKGVTILSFVPCENSESSRICHWR